MTRRNWLRATLVMLGANAAIGCGSKRGANTTTVRGQILYRGEPISSGLIVFAPNVDRGSDGPLATGVLQADGSFEANGDDGKPVAPGWYRIAIAPPAGSVASVTPDQPYPGLPTKYRNPARSGIEREIKSGVENLILIDLDDS
jgi:hypothetical protein